uniref:4-coumarate:CoA ligase n=1 Tax=Inonotus obliquus TaxID=167356 RepID=A0A0A7MAE8_9AGAM|nr:4-coumarate:CoA ligase [Inonotus obliquus]
MSTRIYKSVHPKIDIPDCSVFSHLFPKVDKFPESTAAFIDSDTGLVLTRGDLRTKSLELAHGLRFTLNTNFGGPKLVRGDTVLVFSPNTVAYPIVFFAAFAAGLKASLANAAYMPSELAYQYQDSGARVVITYPALLPVVLKMFELLKVDAKRARQKIIVAGWGLKDKGPKGFVQMEDLLGTGRLEVEEKFDGPLANETTLLCYSSGILNLLQVCLLNCVPVVVMPRFEPVAFCKIIEKFKITFVFVVPPILVLLSRHPVVDQYNLKSLRRLVSGAAPLGASLTKAVVNRLRSRGAEVTIVQGYGLTETSPNSHLLPQVDAERKIGSIGLLLPNLEARIVSDDGEDAKEGEPGELWLRGPTIMKGYLNKPDATRDSITPEGFFKTGDVAIVDNEGYYYIVDRKKELIKYKGSQVPPAELEAVLLQHPDIADAGVVGVTSHTEATELPRQVFYLYHCVGVCSYGINRAYVVHAKGLPEDEKERQAFPVSVQKWIEGRVARHKYLRGGVVVIEAIPKR